MYDKRLLSDGEFASMKKELLSGSTNDLIKSNEENVEPADTTCENCGADVSPDDTFCCECGTQLNEL